MKRKKKSFWWIIPIAVIAALAGGLFYFRAHPVQAKAPTIDLAQLTTTRVVVGSVSTGIGATGTVSANQEASLAWKTNGQVAKVLVAQGDQVKANQILAQIDPKSSPTLTSAQANLQTAQQTLANDQNVAVSQANAQVALINAQNAVTTAQTALNNIEVMPTAAQISAAQATYLSDQQAVDRAQKAFDQVSGWATDNLTRAQDLAALDQAINQENKDKATLDYLQNYKPDPTTLAQDQANLALAQAQLTVAQSNYDAVKNGPNQAQIAADQANINSIQSTIDEQYIRAPFDGTITSLSVKTGDTVSSGTAAFVIDDLSKLTVALQVSEVDINNVKVGQQVDLTFDAIPSKQYTATVSNISMVGTVSGGVANFTVTATMTDADNLVKPGMTATANIVTNSASNVMLVPNGAIASLGSNKIIYVEANGAVTPVRVTVGLASDTQTEVTASSLKAGDLVVTDPSAMTTAASSANTGILGSLLRRLGVTRGGSGFAGEEPPFPEPVMGDDVPF